MSGSCVESVLRLSEGRGPWSRLRYSQKGEMLIAVRESGEHGLKRLYCDLRRGACRCHETARSACSTVRGVVCVMRARAIRLDVRSSVRAKTAFH